MTSDPPQRSSSVLATLVLENFRAVSLRGEDDRDTLVEDVTAPADSRSETHEIRRITVRYDDMGRIGKGGMGEVRRVRDIELNRVLAMKLVHPALLEKPKLLARFVEEAQATAQLQHPGIVPVHEIGTLDDGRVFFTMREVRGRTFTKVIGEVHSAVVDGQWEPAASGWTFRRLVSSLLAVSRAVAYAHERGVLHRDLKPDNVMVGEHAEVYVVDWGLAKVIGRTDVLKDLEDEDTETDTVVTDRSRSDDHGTRFGVIAGTPAYMSPEQARGDSTQVDARSDVYALGAMLYEVLCGRPPYEGETPKEILNQVLVVPPAALDTESAAAPIPQELVLACHRAMARNPVGRFATADRFADELEAWIDGARRREQALAIVERARAMVPEAAAMRVRAAELQKRSRRLLEDVEPWQPEEDKAGAWAMWDEAGTLLRDADLRQLEVDQVLQGALQLVPDFADAHAMLALRYLERQRAAESERDLDAAARAEAQLVHHARSLPPTHPTGRKCTAWLEGTGALTLVTDPPGAEVLLHRYTLRNRRRVATFERSLGATPLSRVPLPMGSYLCILRHPDRAPVRYPVEIGRRGHWSGVPPGESTPAAIRLPAKDRFDRDTVYVPAGWFASGGDAEAFVSHPARRVWVDGFVCGRFPVTNRAYLEFLNDLAASGRDSEALGYAPTERGAGAGTQIYGRVDGRFVLQPDADGDLWDLDWPVIMISWSSARAYSAWLADKTGIAWRLPSELEREKASRGVDGRWFPWGQHFDPSWSRMAESHRGPRMPAVVDSVPTDASVYDVRGVAGNVGDWCLESIDCSPPTEGSRALRVEIDEAKSRVARVVRGGSWLGTAGSARCANRLRCEAETGDSHIGFRVFASLQ